MKIGIIGGSGLDNPELLEDYHEEEVETQYGKMSSVVSCGKLNGGDVYILARHGKNHEIPPHKVNYRANIAGLKSLGCECVLATSAVGSLKQEIEPGDLVFINQFIDFTKQRQSSFYDEPGEVRHEPMAEPFSEKLRKLLGDEADKLGFKNHKKGTIVVVEGPRFSTRAESFMFRNLGADVIGMTAVPECVLAREAGLEYATIGMSTDYDCWKQDEEPVNFEIVLKRMKENADKVKKLIINVLPRIAGKEVSDEDKNFIKNKIRTIPDFPKQGIMFRDITTLLKDKDGMEKVIEIFVERYKNKRIDVVASIESRGFILGGILADKFGVGFVPVRKPGKLPAETESEEYELEYGTDKIEIHKDAISSGQRVLVIDDLIATGGTARAACNLIEKLGGKIVEVGFVIELPDLKGREKLSKWDVFSIVGFGGE